MADHFGYAVQFADRPGMWDVDGYAVVVDGYGNLVVSNNELLSTGVLAPVQGRSASASVSSITQTASASGIYNIFLTQTWVQLEAVEISTVIPSGQTPAHCVVQVNGDTVGQTGFGPSSSVLQGVKFTVIDLSTLAAGVLAQGCGIHFRLRLKNSSA
jgi:hypothetical protein